MRCLAVLFLALLALPVEAGQRSSTERCAFLKSQGYSDCHTPKGMVVDHVRPLCAGGADSRHNMQLQWVAEAKAKDRLERQECKR
jgi:hypothetical protein